MKLPNNLGMRLLAIWLIALGLTMGFFGVRVSFPYSGDLVALFAIVIGVLLLLGR